MAIAAQSQIVCIPFSVPYNVEFPDSVTTDSLIAANSWGLSMWSTDLSRYFPYNITPESKLAPGYLYSWVNFTAQGLSGNVDLIRKTAFSFFNDKRFAEPPNQSNTIQMTKQIGGTGWTTETGPLWPKTEMEQILSTTHLLKSGSPNFEIQVTEPYKVPYSEPEYLNGPEIPKPLYGQIFLFQFDNAFFADANPNAPAVVALLDLVYPAGWNNPTDALDADRNIPSRGESFLDITYMINKPFVEIAYKESFGESQGFSDPVRIKAHYNFYLQPYENIIKELSVNMHDWPSTSLIEEVVPLPEWVLPNMYAMLIDSNHDDPAYEFKHADNWHPAAATIGGKGSWTMMTHSIYQSVSVHGGYIPNWLIPGGKTIVQHAGQPLAVTFAMETHNEYLNTFATKLKQISEIPNAGGAHQPKHSLEHILNRKKYATVGMSAHKIKDFMEEADKIKKFFPMYTEIEIPAANGGNIGKMLYESQTFDQFMQLTMAAMYPQHRSHNLHSQPASFKSAIIKKDAAIRKDDSTSQNLNTQEDGLYSGHLLQLKLNEFLRVGSMLNLSDSKELQEGADGHKTYMKWIHTHFGDNTSLHRVKILNSDFTGQNAVKPVIFGAKEASPIHWISNIKWMATRNKINNFIKEKTRNVSDIYNGDYAYSEVLFYEVAKFSLSRGEKSFVQNIFLPNVPGMEVLKYIDTQVKFGEEYYYQVYAHTLVAGTVYGLNESHAPALGGEGSLNHIWLKYNFAPAVYLIRTPYYNTPITMQKALNAPNYDPGSDGAMQDSAVFDPENLEITPVWDKPPVFPDINFLPLYGERNKILLNVNFNIGEYDLQPVFIDPDEEGTFNKIKKNQRKIEKNDEITFRGDDFCGQIEILRIDKKPFSYADFSPVSNSKIAILGGSSAFGYIDDTLQSNKDYYYIARAKDAHENYSNPSPVYHVRIVAKEGEAPYAVVDMFFIEEAKEKKKKYRKNLMKYIKIQPSFKQTYLHEATLKELSDISQLNATNLPPYIGDSQLSREVFGEKFKFRFTSKKTGKRFDLNLFVKNPFLIEGEDKTSKGVQGKYSSGKC